MAGLPSDKNLVSAMSNFISPVRHAFASVRASLTKPFSFDALMNSFANESYSQESVFEDAAKSGIARKEFYRMMEDPEIGQAIDTRINAIAAIDFRLEGGNKNDNAHVYAQIDENKTEAVESIISAKWFGFAVPNIVWQNIDAGNVSNPNALGAKQLVGIKTVIQTPIQDFTISKDGTLKHSEPTIQKALQKNLDEGSLMIIQHRATPKRPHGRALLASLYVTWCVKQFSYEQWAKFCERFGTPFLVGKIKDPGAMVQLPDGSISNETMLQAMNRALDSATRGSAIAIGADDDVSMLEAGSASPFEGIVSKCEAVIQKVILGQTLTSDNAKGGSNALGQVHDQVRRDKRDADLVFCAKYMQQIVNNLWRHNEFVGAPPRFYWQVPVGLNIEQAQRDEALRMMMWRSGLRLTEKYFLDTYNYNQDHLELAPVIDASATGTGAVVQNSFYALALKQGGVTEAGDAIEKSILAENLQPIPTDVLLKVVQGSASEEDMLHRLARVSSPDNIAQFAMAMNSCRVIAEMQGYLSAKERVN
jgi:phage gp29-like protein